MGSFVYENVFLYCMMFTQYVALVLNVHVISFKLMRFKVYLQEMQNGGLQLWSV